MLPKLVKILGLAVGALFLCQCDPAPPSGTKPPTDSKPGEIPGSHADSDPASGADSASANFAPRARTKSELEPGVVTFASYNLRNWLTMERNNKEQPKPEKETRAVVSMLQDVKPDILGVCEIGTEDDLRDLQSRLKSAGVDLPFLEYCDGPDAHRNLAMLSKFPIVARDHQTNLTYQIGGTTLPFNRGILDATVEPAPGFQVRLIGAHLKSKRPVDEADEAEMRRNEARLLRKHVEKIMAASPETKLLVYGDLNDTKNTEVIKDIVGKEGRPDHLYDLWVKDRFGFAWTHYWNAADAYARIDYILYSKPLAPQVLRRDSYIHHAPEWFSASDHRPLVMRISPKAERRKSGN